MSGKHCPKCQPHHCHHCCLIIWPFKWLPVCAVARTSQLCVLANVYAANASTNLQPTRLLILDSTQIPCDSNSVIADRPLVEAGTKCQDSHTERNKTKHSHTCVVVNVICVSMPVAMLLPLLETSHCWHTDA